MSFIALFYLSDSRYGGHVTYTAHLAKSLRILGHRVELFKLGAKTETRVRDYGYGESYRNLSEFDALAMRADFKVISATGAGYGEKANLLMEAGARIVIHDPTEFRDGLDWKLSGRPPIVIRKSMLRHLPGAAVTPHPYVRHFKGNVGSSCTINAVCFARIDWDKHTDIILGANRLLAEPDQVRLFGAENRLYTAHKIMPEYPEWTQQRRDFPKVAGAAAMIAQQARFVVDMSAIKGDGGGTQYTFLEAWDAGAVCVLNTDWFASPGEMQPGVHCLTAASPSELANRLRYRDVTAIRKLRQAGWDLLNAHAPIVAGKAFMEALHR